MTKEKTLGKSMRFLLRSIFLQIALLFFVPLKGQVDPVPFRNKLSLFVVNDIDKLLTSQLEQDQLFDFVKNQNIGHLFLLARIRDQNDSSKIAIDYLDSLQRAPLQAFMRRAHAKGLSVMFYEGDDHWLEMDNQFLAIQSINKYIRYNVDVSPEERFDGIHFDIVPGRLGHDRWQSNSGKGKDRYNDQFETIYLWILTSARDLLKAFDFDDMTISASIPSDYSYYVTDMMEPLYSASSPLDFVVIREAVQSKEQVIKGVDQIGGIKTNLVLAKTVPLLFALDIEPEQDSLLINYLINDLPIRFNNDPLYLGLAIYNYANFRSLAQEKQEFLVIPPKERFLWFWDENESLLTNENLQTEFFNFIKAPHANHNARITTLYYSADIYDPKTRSFRPNLISKIRRFLRKASKNGLKVEFLAGQPNWVFDRFRQDPIFICRAVIRYNQGVNPKERFSGLHFDIEPHTLGPIWEEDNGKGQDGYNDRLQNNLLYIYKTCRKLINRSGQKLTLTGDFPSHWEQASVDVMKELMGINSPLSYITIMNYYNNYKEFIFGINGSGGIEANLVQSHIPVIFGAETLFPSQAEAKISFYTLGNAALESVISRTEKNMPTILALKELPFTIGIAIAI